MTFIAEINFIAILTKRLPLPACCQTEIKGEQTGLLRHGGFLSWSGFRQANAGFENTAQKTAKLQTDTQSTRHLIKKHAFIFFTGFYF